MRTLLVLSLVLTCSLLAFACNGDSKPKDDGGTANGVDIPTPSGPALDDAAYMKVFCTGLTNYLDAVNTKPKDGISQAVKDYIASMEKVNPPEDVRAYHAQYLKHIKDALDDPTSLLTRTPPKPAEAIRTRLNEETKKIPECRFPTFLNQG